MNRNLLICLLLFFITWLFVGIYKDDEFNEYSIFLKSTPTLKTLYYSPIGMQDLNIKDLPLAQQREEQAYQYYVRENKTKGILTFVPYILIQLLLSTLIFGIFGNKLSIWKLALHFLINCIPTSIGITYLINSGHLLKGVGVMLMVMAINYFSFLLIHRFRKCVYH